MTHRFSTLRTAALITFGTLLVAEVASHVALRWVPEPARDVRFVYDEVWAHARNPFHQPDRDLFWTMIPGSSASLVSINHEGFRGPGFARKKPARTYRVVVLGDSVTFGYGVPENVAYARRLEQLLSVRDASGAVPPRVEVINAGVIGYTSWQGHVLYERTITHFDPDLVIALFGYNDHHSAVESDLARYRRRYVVAASQAVARMAAFKLVARLRDRVFGADVQREPVVRVSVEEFEDNLLALRTRVEADGARSLFLTVPLRQHIPLVENFRAVDYDEDGRRKRVWMRQIDFALRFLSPARGEEVRRHFLDPSAGLSAFAQDAGACARVRAMASSYPDLAIFLYLSATCSEGDRENALEARSRVEAADGERREMEAYNAQLLDMAARSRLDVIDVAAAFRTAGSNALLADVVHPTAAGHALIARLLASRIMVQ